MKKLIALLLVLVLTLSLCVGCAGNKNPGQVSGGDEDVDGKTTLTIGLSANANILDYENNALNVLFRQRQNAV